MNMPGIVMQQHTAHQYTCSMHPDVVKDAPGDCPKCGMKLVEKN
jgi:heavy metal-binding protein